MQTHTTTDGTALQYATYGFDDDSRETVVLLNGVTQTAQRWQPLATPLSEQFRVLTYNARGQGRSEVGDKAFTLDLHADDLAHLLDELGVDAANLVGFSHGARVSLGFAKRHPDRAKKLVLCGASADSTALTRTTYRSWFEVLRRADLEAMVWSAVPSVVGERYLRGNEPFLDHFVRIAVDENCDEGIRGMLEGILHTYRPLEQVVEGISTPTLFVSGSHDRLASPAGARRLACAAGGKYVEVKECGHYVPMEDPQKFYDLVTDFLR